MKLIVGLGNPGEEYKNTRHNLGFMAIDFLHSDDFSTWKLAHGAYVARGEFKGAKCMLVKPQSYMNASGRPVQELAAWYKVEPKDIIVVHDELDLPLGTVRAKTGGSSAGHHGIESIAQSLGTPEFARVRIGMRSDRAETVPGEKFVLEKFTPDEKPLVDEALKLAVTKIEELVDL